jgi:hypothetical protein
MKESSLHVPINDLLHVGSGVFQARLGLDVLRQLAKLVELKLRVLADEIAGLQTCLVDLWVPVSLDTYI